ncbi:MAD2L1-binding protein-like [Diadema antillarum]|uniref:MAD2L1-binding protein-like n=1 Tax=Diadema antillarum TaxID=105358 RepID=UPI003A840EC1
MEPKAVSEDPDTECNINLNGFITQTTKSRIVVEILKYILYHREQIPLPFDQLYFQYQRPEVCSSGNKKSLFKKRMCQVMKDFQEVFDNVDTLFQDTDVSDLIILLGSTWINPKEVFHIRFSNNKQVKETLTVKHCVRNVARSLITNGPLSDVSPPPITSLLCLAHAPRSYKPTWFKPKANFKVPSKGRQCRINVSCGMVHSSLAAEDHIWMQTPSGIKGIRDTVSEHATDLWSS